MLRRLCVLLACLQCVVVTSAGAKKRPPPAESPVQAEISTNTPPPPPPDQPPPPPSGVEARGSVDGYISRATQLFQENKNIEAAEELKKAYALEPRSQFLFNIGQAYRRASRPKDALEHYQRFVDTDPKNTLAPEAKGYIADMKALLAEQQRAELDRLQAQVALQNEQYAAQVAKQALVEEKLKQERKPIYKRAGFWAVVGGGIGIALSIVVGFVTERTKDRATDFGQVIMIKY